MPFSHTPAREQPGAGVPLHAMPSHNDAMAFRSLRVLDNFLTVKFLL